MSQTQKVQAIVVSVITTLLVLVGLVMFAPKTASQAFGANLPTDGTVSNTTGTIYASAGVFTDGPVSLYNYLQFQSGTAAASAATSTSYEMTGQATSCITSSSTVFAIQNPFAATSTLVVDSFSGTMGATTSDMLVATSTTPAPATGLSATSSLGANIFQIAAVAANTKFYSVAGVTIGPGKGYTNPKGIPGSNSFQTIVVGPSEWVIGFSTSTGSGSGGTASGQVSVPSSCTFHSHWEM